ncbi:protein argonaute-2-like [Hylaeus volcanicus]|uniref:protein argonaute-2-like n=1 Tax=Hylaeus volcanicus TaxID=313075 RepID=UPI0023B7892E|nr:protein argonaute-2-like [Hylaeus volcanicus]
MSSKRGGYPSGGDCHGMRYQRGSRDSRGNCDSRGGRDFKEGRYGGNRDGNGRGNFKEFRGSDKPRGGMGGRQEILNVPQGKYNVASNQYILQLPKNAFVIYQNLVTIKDARSDTFKLLKEENEDILRSYLREKKVPFWDILPYDGENLLISSEPIKNPITTHKFSGKEYVVEIMYNNISYDISKILSEEKGNAEAVHCLSLILRMATRVTQTTPDAKRFLPENPSSSDIVELRSRRNLSIILGHTQSLAVNLHCKLLSPALNSSLTNWLQQKQSKYLAVAINPACKLAIQRQSIAAYCLSAFNVDLFSKNISSNNIIALSSLKNLKAETHYMPDPVTRKPSKRTFKIERISFEETPMSYKFDYEGSEITLLNYFEKRYKIFLKHPRGPLVQMRPAKKKTFIPVELVEISYQYMKNMEEEDIKTAMATSMIMDPGSRLNYCSKKRQLFDKNPVMEHFKLGIETKPQTYNAFILKPPSIMYSNDCKAPIKGSWNLERKKLLLPITLNTLIIVAINTRNFGEEEVKRFAAEFLQTARLLGFKGTLTYKVIWATLKNLDTVKHQLSKKTSTEFVLFILPSQEIDAYENVKNSFYPCTPGGCVVALQTPILNPRKRPSTGHFANILCKINKKMGGINHSLSGNSETTSTLFGANKSFAIVAYSMLANSIPSGPKSEFDVKGCALLASLSGNVQHFKSDFWVQLCNETKMDVFKTRLTALFKKTYNSPKKNWPQRLVVFREGVPEMKKEEIVAEEVALIKNCYELESLPEPDIIVLCVYRMQAVRFFNSISSAPENSNIPPGTVIYESAVASGTCPNFVLVAHAGLKGTSRCPRYYIVHDDLSSKKKLSIMFWIQFCLEQCYSYEVCQRAVSYVAPLFYAKKLSDRAFLHAKTLLRSSRTKIDSLLKASSLNTDDKTVPSISEVIQASVQKINTHLSHVREASSDMFFI